MCRLEATLRTQSETKSSATSSSSWRSRPTGGRLGVRAPTGFLAGDFNIDPLIADVRSRERLPLTVKHTEIEIIYLEHLRRAGGWIDAFRLKHPDDEPSFTCCSHRAGNWDPVSRGQRLDHIWISKNLKPVVKTAEIFKEALGWDLPSDHAPVIVTLDARLQT